MTIRMMPSQEPYTERELAILTDLTSAACDAEELFELDDLEAYAEAWRAKNAIA